MQISSGRLGLRCCDSDATVAANRGSRTRALETVLCCCVWRFVGRGLNHALRGGRRTFAYEAFSLNISSAGPCSAIGASVTVTNTVSSKRLACIRPRSSELRRSCGQGGADSDEVVQLYIKQPHATSPAPQVRLVDFARVHIAAGSSKTVALSFGPKEQALVTNDTGVYHPTIVVEQGAIEVRRHSPQALPSLHGLALLVAAIRCTWAEGSPIITRAR